MLVSSLHRGSSPVVAILLYAQWRQFCSRNYVNNRIHKAIYLSLQGASNEIDPGEKVVKVKVEDVLAGSSLTFHSVAI
jgi:hypothetical protein